MGRKRQDSIFEMVADAPWWVGVVMASVTYGGLKWLMPNLATGNPILVPLSEEASQLAWVPAVLFLLPAGVSAVRQFPAGAWRGQRRRFAQPSFYVEPVIAGAVEQSFHDGWPRIQVLPPRLLDMHPAQPDSWSLQVLRALEWHRFEKLAADFYDVQGYKARVTRYGADGGVDVELFRAENPKPIALLQCKAWNAYKVGVKPVRELFGVMAAQNVPNGIFLTTGEFTNEAREFARSKPLELIDGDTLIARIREMPVDVSRALLERATEGDYTTPTCPKCGVKMTRRSSKNGSFWGCVRYPRCRQSFALPSLSSKAKGSSLDKMQKSG